MSPVTLIRDRVETDQVNTTSGRDWQVLVSGQPAEPTPVPPAPRFSQLATNIILAEALRDAKREDKRFDRRKVVFPEWNSPIVQGWLADIHSALGSPVPGRLPTRDNFSIRRVNDAIHRGPVSYSLRAANSPVWVHDHQLRYCSDTELEGRMFDASVNAFNEVVRERRPNRAASLIRRVFSH